MCATSCEPTTEEKWQIIIQLDSMFVPLEANIDGKTTFAQNSLTLTRN